MFRRPGKNPLEEEAMYHQEEKLVSSPFKYGPHQGESGDVTPPRIFEQHPHQGHHGMGGHSVPVAHPMEEESWGAEKTVPHHFEGMMSEEDPETTLGEGVTFRGQLSFERLLRIDGTFEGELLSQGKVIVGPKGKIKANLNLREAIVEGEIEGNITVQEKLELRGEAVIRGDITAKALCVDEGVSIIGHVNVTPTSEAPTPPPTSEY